MNKKLIIGISLIVVIGGFFGLIQVYKKTEVQRVSKVIEQKTGMLVRQHSPRIGSNLARVQLVEFLDPECEACAAFYPKIKQLVKKYDGKVQLVVRYAPFHRNSRFAVALLETARSQGKYWETLEVLFKNVSKWGNHHNPQPELIWDYLPALGLNIDQMKEDLKNESLIDFLKYDIQDGQELGVRRTPTFFVNGVSPAQFGVQALDQAIQAELAK